MREICTSGLMSGEGKRNASLCVTAPFLDSTAWGKNSAQQKESIWRGALLHRLLSQLGINRLNARGQSLR
jgi:hypothetical protein